VFRRFSIFLSFLLPLALSFSVLGLLFHSLFFFSCFLLFSPSLCLLSFSLSFFFTLLFSFPLFLFFRFAQDTNLGFNTLAFIRSLLFLFFLRIILRLNGAYWGDARADDRDDTALDPSSLHPSSHGSMALATDAPS
jgi:hypothetical protein